jgi:hypothetical protein
MLRKEIAAVGSSAHSWPRIVWITSGVIWPIDAATKNPVAYPPAHFHHSMVKTHRDQGPEYTILEMQSGRKHDVGAFAFEADSYCRDCTDHALWQSFPKLHGEPWPWMQSNISSSGMVETRSVQQGCPAMFEPELNVSIELALRVLIRPVGPMTEVWGISSSMAGYGDPTDRAGKHFDGRSELATTLMRVPAGKSIMQYEQLRFVTDGHNVKRDFTRPDHLKVHSHTEWLDSIWIIAGDAASAGLSSFNFEAPLRDFAFSNGVKRQQQHNGRLPLLLHSTETLLAAKSRVLAHLSNGMSAALAIQQLGVTQDDLRRESKASTARGQGHNTSAAARLLCVHLPVKPKPYTGCRTFARRSISVEPPEGKCLFDWKAGDAHLWVMFATNDGASPVDMHATIRYSMHTDPLPSTAKMLPILDHVRRNETHPRGLIFP